jgi:hypothetical protein
VCVRGTRLHICLNVRGVMNKANRIKEKGLVEGGWYCSGDLGREFLGTRVSREGIIGRDPRGC